MPNYVLNKNAQSTGEREVHATSCSYLPAPANQIDLGWHADCHGAVNRARQLYPAWDIDGCAHCSPACHSR